MKTPQKLIRDMISKDKWIECPVCLGGALRDEKNCKYCKGEGIIKTD